jgi:hypothetical protein
MAKRHHRTEMHERPQEGRRQVLVSVRALVSRVQRATPDGHGRRKFDYLGGYPTKAAARSALEQALGRHRGNLAPDRPGATSAAAYGPAHPTLNDLLDHWLVHLQTNKAVRLRTVGRYRQLLEHHLRPCLGEHPVSSLGTSTSNSCTTTWPRTAARTARRAGWAPAPSGRCTSACTRPSVTP